MAKKRKKEKEEKYVFEPPEFDEIEFMEKEMLGGKVGVAVALFAIPLAVGSYALTIAQLPVIAFFFGLGGMFLLKLYIQFVGFDTEGWEKKVWAGHGATYFFTWLAVWVLLVNAPFSDLVGPSIRQVTVINGDIETSVTDGERIVVILNGSNQITIQARVGDNAALQGVSLTIVGPITEVGPMTSAAGPHVYRYVIVTPSAGNSTVELTAADRAGHTTSFTFVIDVA